MGFLNGFILGSLTSDNNSGSSGGSGCLGVIILVIILTLFKKINEWLGISEETYKLVMKVLFAPSCWDVLLHLNEGQLLIKLLLTILTLVGLWWLLFKAMDIIDQYKKYIKCKDDELEDYKGQRITKPVALMARLSYLYLMANILVLVARILYYGGFGLLKLAL